MRLDPDEKQRLKAAAERLGLTTSAMIRLLVKSFVEEYDRAGGRLTLPPVWQSTDGAKKSRRSASVRTCSASPGSG